MDRKTIIDGLKMTMELCVFDPSTGEEIEPHLLNDINRATYDACKGALEILEQLPSAEPQVIACGEDELSTNLAEVGTNLISRQAVISLWDKYHYTIAVNAMGFDRELRDLPVAEPQERKTGRWIFNQYDANPKIGNWHCSECGQITIMPHDVCNYCPNCGARMEVEHDT